MRPRTDSRSGKTAPALLEKHFREIVVGSGRSQEPYIIAFHYASDNVSGSPLGTLFGFFEVEIHDQDAAYIVNFLASVAKKEYFANSRRTPIESFEAALHKINVALAEIVKHGNISWLGHLHGAIGAVSQNTLNFSVTGEGSLYLAREETLRPISEGLADSESEPHPLKTFTEVSSGDLFDGDLIFAISPSIWSLFSPEDLRRSLNRLGPAGFEQFLRTALVNELPIAAVALITCSAPVELQKPEKSKEPAATLENVWSDAPFTAALRAKQPAEPAAKTTAPEEKREEYTDKKTGHIYVQASPDEEFEPVDSPWKERWIFIQHELGTMTHAWGVALKKISRRLSKESSIAAASVSARSGQIGRSLGRRIRSWQRTLAENRARRIQEKEELARLKAAEEALVPKSDPKPPVTQPQSAVPTEPTEPTPSPEETPAIPNSERVRRFFQREPRPEMTFSDEAKDQLDTLRGRLGGLKPMLGAYAKIAGAIFSRALSFSREKTGMLLSWFNGLWQTLSPKEKWSVLGVASIILAIGVIALISSGDAGPTAEETKTEPVTEVPAQPTFPPANEPFATLLSENRSIAAADGARPIAFVTINDTTFLAAERAIINLKTGESVASPESIRLAAGMDDLDAVFALGESGTLYLWSAVTKKFEQNTLPLPSGTKPSALGAYLTYLYVLDQAGGMIYRFPRADGGFGAPTRWLKETVTLADSSDMAVFENVALTLRNKEPALYSRGVRTSATFASTTTLVTTDALAFDWKTGDLLVLDRANKRIVRWSATGTLLAQYFHESLGTVETFSVSPDASEILVSNQEKTTAWQMR